jgi:ABC-type Fe3+/spermidine/putrescine transport system ATPase subunit
MLEISNLQARFGKRFSLDIDRIQVAPGEIVAVLGPNGSGKTSLLRIVAGLVAPDAGTVRWSGETLSSAGRVVVPPEDRATAMLFQEGVLFPHLDVRGNVELGVPDAAAEPERDERTSEALKMMQLEPLSSQSIGVLSGGEQQRVALARAIAQRPRMLLLDEPFHSLDGVVKRQIVGELRALVPARSIAAMLVTHDLEEASALCDRVVLTRDGRVVQQGPLQELRSAPVEEWVASFVGERLAG